MEPPKKLLIFQEGTFQPRKKNILKNIYILGN